MPHKFLGNIIFYGAVSIPAYILIVYGLRGIGIYSYPQNPVYSYSGTSFDLWNFVPNPIFAPYFLIAGLGILGGIIFRAFLKYRSKK